MKVKHEQADIVDYSFVWTSRTFLCIFNDFCSNYIRALHVLTQANMLFTFQISVLFMLNSLHESFLAEHSYHWKNKKQELYKVETELQSMAWTEMVLYPGKNINWKRMEMWLHLLLWSNSVWSHDHQHIIGSTSETHLNPYIATKLWLTAWNVREKNLFTSNLHQHTIHASSKHIEYQQPVLFKL